MYWYPWLRVEHFVVVSLKPLNITAAVYELTAFIPNNVQDFMHKLQLKTS